MEFDKIRIKLDDHGKGSVWIGNGEQEIQLAATTSIRIVARPNTVTLVTIRMIANVEFEGEALLSFEQARATFPEVFEDDLNRPYDEFQEKFAPLRLNSKVE
jgi:hypothetical protein